MTDVLEFELNVPSGKIVVANDLRPWFPAEEPIDELPGRDDLTRTTRIYAGMGMAHAYVQDSCPGVYKGSSENSFIVGQPLNEVWDEAQQDYIENPEPPPWGEEVATIFTDLSWYSMADYDELQRRKEHYKIEAYEGDQNVLQVRPGVYRFRHSMSFKDRESHRILATFEWVRDPDPVKDYLAVEKAKHHSVIEILLEHILTYPDLYIRPKPFPEAPKLPPDITVENLEVHQEAFEKWANESKKMPLWTREEAKGLWRSLSCADKAEVLGNAALRVLSDSGRSWHENGFPNIPIAEDTKVIAHAYGNAPPVYTKPLKGPILDPQDTAMLRCPLAPDFARLAKNLCAHVIQHYPTMKGIYTKALEALEAKYPVNYDEVLEAIRGGIEGEGFNYYFRSHSSPESVERHHGPIPPLVREAWVAYLKAADALENLVYP